MRHAHSYQTIPSEPEDRAYNALNAEAERAKTLAALIELAVDVHGEAVVASALSDLLADDSFDAQMRVDDWFDKGMRR